jgi:hypothetical protein
MNALSVITDKFVGRKKQISLVEERINIMRYGSSVFQALISFHGVIGIGKTMLLRELEKRTRGMGFPCALIDFAKKVYAFSPLGKMVLLEDLAHSLTSSATYPWQPQPEGEPAEDQVQSASQAFLEYVSGLTRDQGVPAVLLFDTLEQADADLLDWLEDKVISPLIRTDHVLVIVASRAPHRWKRFEVRRRAYQERLEPFDEETTKEQLPQKYNVLVPDVVRLTYGHPFGNVQVLESVRQIERDVGRPFRSADFEEYQKRLVQELVDKLIDPVVMKDVSRDIRRACRVVSLARQFDVNVLRRLLTRFVEEPFAGKSAAYFLSVVGTMVKTTLVEWSSARRGYVLDQTIRRMLALNMELAARDRYKKINQELIALYEEWIERVPENRSGFIRERLYHEGCLQSARGMSKAEIADRLCDLLKSYVDQYYPMTERGEMPPGLTALQEELSTDEELMGFLPRDRETCLTDIIQEVVNRNYRQRDTTSSNPGGQA